MTALHPTHPDYARKIAMEAFGDCRHIPDTMPEASAGGGNRGAGSGSVGRMLADHASGQNAPVGDIQGLRMGGETTKTHQNCSHEQE